MKRGVEDFSVIGTYPLGYEDGIFQSEFPSPIFSAPLNDPDNPLRVITGGPLTMARATTALRFDGTKYVDSANDILRIETGINSVVLGALIEGQRTFDELLRTDTSQDQLASWTSTGITATSDADAVAYGGNRWTLTADGSDRVFVQTITIAAATRSLGFYVRRTDGGVVDGTFCLIYREGSDRTTTYTHIGGNVYRVQEANFTGSAGAAATGLKVKAGKTVQLVAPMGLEDGAFSASPIPTVAAAVTRNADLLTFPSSGNMLTNVGTVIMSVDNPNLTIAHLLNNVDSAGLVIFFMGNFLSYYDGNVRTSSLLSAGSEIVGLRYSGITATIAKNGILDDSLVFDGDLGLGANVLVGAKVGSPANVIFGHIKGLEIYGVAFSGAQMIAKTS